MSQFVFSTVPNFIFRGPISNTSDSSSSGGESDASTSRHTTASTSSERTSASNDPSDDVIKNKFAQARNLPNMNQERKASAKGGEKTVAPEGSSLVVQQGRPGSSKKSAAFVGEDDAQEQPLPIFEDFVTEEDVAATKSSTKIDEEARLRELIKRYVKKETKKTYMSSSDSDGHRHRVKSKKRSRRISSSDSSPDRPVAKSSRDAKKDSKSESADDSVVKHSGEKNSPKKSAEKTEEKTKPKRSPIKSPSASGSTKNSDQKKLTAKERREATRAVLKQLQDAITKVISYN